LIKNNVNVAIINNTYNIKQNTSVALCLLVGNGPVRHIFDMNLWFL